jgi:predicted RNA-binding protein with PUA-like domain
MMNYWLVKSEPSEYGWNDLVAKKEDIWDGIRNFQARNYLKEMRLGDQVLFYHSGKNKEIVGVAEVSSEAFPDAKDTENQGWVAVSLKASKALSKPVSLEIIKADDRLGSLPLLRQSRLSVMPVEKNVFDLIIKMGS